MYQEHFTFRSPPFSIAPDPHFLYMSERHREALAHLLYGIRGNGGFVLLTGEVGTGKTTVCRCLLEQVPKDTNIAFILNPKLTAEELLETICDEFGIEQVKTKSIKGYIDSITDFLLEAHAKAQKSVLIIDEAQNLSIDVLEQIRLLTNLETNERKLLQIILLGQPELKEKVSRPELRQLAQRITARYHLEPLSEKEVAAYVNHRLTIAGAKGRIFPEASTKILFRLSHGTPRVINIICDRALLGAYAENKNQVSKAILKKAGQEVLGKPPVKPQKSKNSFFPLAASALLLTAFLLVIVLYNRNTHFFALPWFDKKTDMAGERILTEPLPVVLPESVTETEPLPDPGQEQATVLLKAENPLLSSPLVYSQEQPVEAKAADEGRTESLLSQLSPLEWPEKAPREKSREMAYQSLFASWGVPYKTDMTLSPCKIAEKYSLRCMTVQGSLESLTKLNRPAVLTFYDDRGPFFATMTSITEKTATFIIGQENRTVSVDAMGGKWLGEYSLFWARPQEYTKAIMPGNKNVNVDWLDKKLAFIQQRPALPRAIVKFDENLALQVKQFQFDRGLVPDGIVGPQTIIHLNSACGIGVPKLFHSPEDL